MSRIGEARRLKGLTGGSTGVEDITRSCCLALGIGYFEPASAFSIEKIELYLMAFHDRFTIFYYLKEFD